VAWRRRSPSGGVQPDMNVTPLVDVVLVLLIIFMVVAPRLEQDVPVELPGVFNPDPEVETSADPLRVSVATRGEYYINQEKYDLDGAITFLSDAHAVDPYRRLVLRADSRLTYGDVREIFARAQEVGFPGIALLVGERHRSGEPKRAEPPAEG
jgi:biopolymer transport protein TolR